MKFENQGSNIQLLKHGSFLASSHNSSHTSTSHDTYDFKVLGVYFDYLKTLEFDDIAHWSEDEIEYFGKIINMPIDAEYTNFRRTMFKDVTYRLLMPSSKIS